MREGLLEARDLGFSYGPEEVLRGVDLHVDEGEMAFVLGPNGSGKTTLLRCLAKVLRYRGAVMVEGVDLRELSQREAAKLFGYLPQRAELAPLVVFDAVMLGRKPHMGWRPSNRDREVVERVIRALRLEDLVTKPLTALSGGELQRVAIARALAQEPKVLLLDEPTNNLDLANQMEVMEILKGLKGRGLSSVITTHDLNLALLYADRVVMMKDGRVFASGGREVLDEGNIEEVYGIKAEIYHVNGRRVVFPKGKPPVASP